MSAQHVEIDPFAGATSAPSISFKGAEVGTTYEGVVTDAPKLVQSRDYDTGDPAFWPAKPGETPNPKMSVVIRLMVDGEERSLWAQKPSAMFAAIAEAQQKAGARIVEGGKLAVKFTGEKPHTDPVKIKKDMPPQKLYAALYTPPAAADPFAAAPAAPAATDDPPF